MKSEMIYWISTFCGILVFVGLKMVWLNQAFGGKFPITWSLAIIGSVLALSILVSIAARRRAANGT